MAKRPLNWEAVSAVFWRSPASLPHCELSGPQLRRSRSSIPLS